MKDLEREIAEQIRDLCLRHAQMWDDAYTNRKHEVGPSEYLVWRGRAIEATVIAETIETVFNL